MLFKETPLKGAYVIELEQLGDHRGFFARVWCQHEFEEHGLTTEMVQANVSYNKQKGTLRGMHYQRAPHAEDKLVRCTRGAIYDAIVDLRPDSDTYRQWFGVELTERNYKMLYVPKGFAHGFITLDDDVEVTYLVSAFYKPGFEGGLRYDDPAIGIAWPLEPQVVSEKDRSWPDSEAVGVPS